MFNFNKNRKDQSEQESLQTSKLSFPKPPNFNKAVRADVEAGPSLVLKRVKSQIKSKSEAINLINMNSNSSQPETFDKSLYYKDVAIFRFLDSTAQVFSDSNFLNIFYKRPNSPYWKTLDYVQTNIKSKIGIGKPIYIKFYADLASK